MFDGGASGPGTSVGEVRSRWSVTATKTIGRSSREIELFVADAVTEALDAAAESSEARRWRTSLRRPFSMFDQCEITIALVGADDEPASRVEFEMVFDASPGKLWLVMVLATSIVGIPVDAGWRWYSIRSANEQAKEVIDALWRALEVRLAAHAYR